ncbi:hypothetical protein I4U23_016314 [Adineta vaga]|nr:hypothetical protein I4U23_016314 [Adineta vaga]
MTQPHFKDTIIFKTHNQREDVVPTPSGRSDHQAPCAYINDDLSDVFAILPRHPCGSRASYSECAIRTVLVKENMAICF